MPTFPRLRTGAVAQYPVVRRQEYRNHTIRFVDGTDQRYRGSSSAMQRWEIHLNALDEGEIAAIEEFFLANEGAFGRFTFTDPWDGSDHDDCSVELDELAVTTLAEMRGLTQLTVVKNR